MLNIALFGPPGAGKGTQSKALIEKYNLTYISTGDILRKEIAEDTELGRKAKDVIEKGGLADDEIIVQIIEKEIKTHPDSNGILFDGFPRTVVQAYILEGLLLKLNSSLNCMLSLEVPKDDLLKRLTERAKVSGRKDDALNVIKRRLEEYDNKTAPVADFYKAKNNYFSIKGTGSLDEVYQRLDKNIQDVLYKKTFNVVLLGYPGSGKGTQAKLIAKKYNLVYLSTGEMLRKEVSQNTEIGKTVAPMMKTGIIVPDVIAIQLIERKIAENPNARGFIFKGFPMTIVQAYIMDGLLLKQNTELDLVINLDVPTLQCIRRLTERNKNMENRRLYDGDTEMICDRLESYEQKTFPVVEVFNKRKKLVTINGQGSDEEVLERTSSAIENALKKIR